MEGFDIPKKDSICVESDKGQADIKEKLSKACKADEMVNIVKKYCNEEKKGTYFCLKDGRCVENECIGCVRHQCDIDGKRYLNKFLLLFVTFANELFLKFRMLNVVLLISSVTI